MMKSTLFVIFTIVQLCIVLVRATSSIFSNSNKQQEKGLKLDLNLPPPEEGTGQVNSHQLDTNLYLGIGSVAVPDSHIDCDIHHPGCTHWKSIPINERRILYNRWRRKTQTDEERVAYNAASKIRHKRRYKNMTKEQRQAKTLKGSQSRAKRLRNMDEKERKEWFQKNNSYRRKTKQQRE